MRNRLCYRSIPSPLGTLFLAATETGLCRIAWYTSEDAFVAELKEHWDQTGQGDRPAAGEAAPELRPPGGPAPTAVLEESVRQLSGYFDRQRRAFELPLDLSRLQPFQREVLTALLQVAYGEVVSYGELAALAGHPAAARAVGGVMRSNPLPIIIPCHRVILGTGALGGFGGHPELKRRLLELEGWREDAHRTQPWIENLFE